MINLLLNVFKISLIEMLYLTGLILLAGFILGLFERFSNDFMQRSLGRKGVLITAWLGTPIHEIGHAFMCVIFNHRITSIKFLNTRFDNGVLGYVEHSYNQNSVYQRVGNIFIGLGPIFSGTASLILSMYLLLPRSFQTFKTYLIHGINNDRIDSNLLSALLKAGGTLLRSIFTMNNLSNINFWAFIIIAICISSHIALSKPDMKGAEDGLIVLFTLIFILNLVLRYFSLSTTHYIIQLGRYNAHLIAFLMIALVFSLLTLAVSFLCYSLFAVRR